MSNAAYATVCDTELTVPADTGSLTLEAGTTAVDSNNKNRAQYRTRGATKNGRFKKGHVRTNQSI